MDNIKIQENINLRPFTTMNLGGVVKYFTLVKNEGEIISAVHFAQNKELKIFVLGGGSNIIVKDNLYPSLVIKMENKGIEIIKDDNDYVYIKVLSGVNWDDFVDYTVSKNFSGIEALSLIPGTVGAAPVQNIGAYGSEVSNVIEGVRFYNIEIGKFEMLDAQECEFSYRDSIFKNKLKNKAIIESVIFRLKKSTPEIPNYPKVLEFLNRVKDKNTELSLLKQIRLAICEIRTSKLPDPKEIPNTGSFFKNPIASKDFFVDFIDKFPHAKYFNHGDSYKISAGWLVEDVGFKGYKSGGVGTHKDHALVLVNHSSTSTKELLDFAKLIKDSVFKKFSIDLEIEPEIIS